MEAAKAVMGITAEEVEQETYNPEATLDYIRRRLTIQGKPAVLTPGGTSCKYRAQANDGQVLACGIGQILPDAEYQEEFDSPSMTVDTLVHDELSPTLTRIAARIDARGINSTAFLRDIQSAHDSASGLAEAQFVPEVNYRLGVVLGKLAAGHYNRKASIPDTLNF